MGDWEKFNEETFSECNAIKRCTKANKFVWLANVALKLPVNNFD